MKLVERSAHSLADKEGFLLIRLACNQEVFEDAIFTIWVILFPKGLPGYRSAPSFF
jgi:hypothetical protein